MVVNLIKKFTHSGGGGGSAATNSGNGPSSSSTKKGSGRLDHELERLNSKIVSCTYFSLGAARAELSSRGIVSEPRLGS